MSGYHVRARRWAHGWELAISDRTGETGVTQCRRLSAAESMVRDYVALATDVDPGSFDIDISVELDDDLDADAAQARAVVRSAEQAQREAAARSRDVARRLKASGLSGADIAVVLRVFPQRAHSWSGPDAGTRRVAANPPRRPRCPDPSPGRSCPTPPCPTPTAPRAG